jgi:hypothetical protein
VAVRQRVQCRGCSTQWMRPDLACPCCGVFADWKAVKPGAQEVEAIRADVIAAAQRVSTLFRSGSPLRRDTAVLHELADFCRELEWAAQGVLVR